MRRSHVVVAVVLLIALTTFGCSGGDSPVQNGPNQPDNPMTGPPRDLVINGRTLLMAYTVDVDFETGEISLEPLRTVLTHFDVRPLLMSPWFCPAKNCIKIQFIEMDQVNGYFKLKATIVNPSNVIAHDVRGIVYNNDTYTYKLLNPDDYTRLWAPTGYDSVYPFRAFAKTDPNRAIKPLASYSEIYEFQFDPLPRNGHSRMRLTVPGRPTARNLLR